MVSIRNIRNADSLSYETAAIGLCYKYKDTDLQLLPAVI